MPSNSEAALVFDRVTVAYGSVLALQDVHGSVPAGTAVALVGPNGAGKSTLMKMGYRFSDSSFGGAGGRNTFVRSNGNWKASATRVM